MATILLVTFDGGGNLPPLVGIARELVARGHQVRVIGGTLVPGGAPSPRLQRAFEGVGCEVVVLAAAVGAGPPPSADTAVAAIPREFAFIQGLAMFAALSSHWALALSPEIAQRRPDMILVDVCLPGAAFAAEAAGVRYVVLQHTILDRRLLPGTTNEEIGTDASQYRDVYANAALPHMNEARESIGLACTDDPLGWEMAALLDG